jgi:hypothetical protein
LDSVRRSAPRPSKILEIIGTVEAKLPVASKRKKMPTLSAVAPSGRVLRDSSVDPPSEQTGDASPIEIDVGWTVWVWTAGGEAMSAARVVVGRFMVVVEIHGGRGDSRRRFPWFLNNSENYSV